MRHILLGVGSLALLLVSVAAAPGCGDDTSSGFPDGTSSGGTSGCVGFNCGGDGGGSSGTSGGPCRGLECQRVSCDGGGSTTITGVVLDPAGRVPVYNALVYVPNKPLNPVTTGASCDRCDAKIDSEPVAIASTDTSGKFTLTNVPVGDKIPVVIQIGKWRRAIEVARVNGCAETALDAGATRLPKNRTEGNIPRIAVATGGADPLQCLLRKIGIEDSEFGIAGSESRIHLFAGGGFERSGNDVTASKKLASGTAFPPATGLWATKDALAQYDVVLLSCEGVENEVDVPGRPAISAAKPDTAKTALYDYAKAGGRVFASHYHHVFFSRSPDPTVKGIATWPTEEHPPPAAGNPATTAVPGEIVGTFPKALAMKDWLSRQPNTLDANGRIPLFDARHNVDAVNQTPADRPAALNWISANNPNFNNTAASQYLSFNAPVGAADDQVCGRVVFSNLHLAAGPEGGTIDDPQADFPTGCMTTELTAQQRALEFMLFDLSSCVQRDDKETSVPK